jgi:5'-nucleotidase
MSVDNRTVLVDMDGVMVDFDGAALASIPQDERVERTQFYVASDYPVELRPRIEATYNTPGFFENLEPMPGMLEAWQAMIDAGYKPRVASAPLTSNPTSIEGKIKWLNRVMVPKFGPSVVEDAIIDKDKWKYSGLALIDDRFNVPRGANGNVADWEHILFGWPHRVDTPLSGTTFRLISWNDTDHLLTLLEQIQRSKA